MATKSPLICSVIGFTIGRKNFPKPGRILLSKLVHLAGLRMIPIWKTRLRIHILKMFSSSLDQKGYVILFHWGFYLCARTTSPLSDCEWLVFSDVLLSWSDPKASYSLPSLGLGIGKWRGALHLLGRSVMEDRIFPQIGHIDSINPHNIHLEICSNTL